MRHDQNLYLIWLIILTFNLIFFLTNLSHLQKIKKKQVNNHSFAQEVLAQSPAPSPGIAENDTTGNESNETLSTDSLENLTGSLDTVTADSDKAEGDPNNLSEPNVEAIEKTKEKLKEDITDPDPEGEKKSVLVSYLDENPIGEVKWHNIVQYLLRKAISQGLPANIIVLIILFPLIVSIIAISRHVIGLKGFGVYTPAVLSVAFVSTEIPTGIILFILVLLSALISHRFVKNTKMPYLPRTAMLLWGVSILILAFLVLSSFFDFFSLLSVNIFPLLIIMLLTENFLHSQLFNSQKEAFRLTLETLLLASICAFIIGLDQVQKFVILHPEITLASVAIVNLSLGKYKGLRLLEYVRFNAILGKE